MIKGGAGEEKVIAKAEEKRTDTQNEARKTVEPEKKKTENVVALQNKNDLFYAVQVASSKTRIKDFGYLKLKEKVEELKGVDRYRYYVGKTSTYGKALEKQKEIRKVVKDCFIIAIYKGKQITVTEARKIEQKK